MQSLRPIIVPHNRYEPNEKKVPLNSSGSDFVSITPLGSGQEVGRSCIIIKYKGKSVMLDCGLHPALKGQDAMPYLDFLDLESVDLLLVTHFHLDHAACLPYFLSKTSFKSRCFMTHPTKSIYKLIVQDFVKVSTLSLDTVLFGEKELMESMDAIETIDYHQDKLVSGIRFRAYHAGHVLGAAMFMIEIDNVKILYTGDYSCDDDRHLRGAEIPHESPDILIIESTFGTQSLRPVVDREKEFTSLVHQIIKRGGRCLIPVFALGRAQELLLIMDEYWSNNHTLHHIPIYYASALAKKCLGVYATYINMMKPRIQQQYKVSNPFDFRHVYNLRSRDQFNDVGPSVVFASPGMLQNGLSRELFEMWCTDRRNGLVIPGYAVEGTLAKIVQSEPLQVDGMRGGKLPLRMTVHYVMFAAHADHDQTKRFITALTPPNVILVHGERKAMSRVKLSLNRTFGDYIRISDPANCQSVNIEFRKDRVATVVGDLVENLNKNTNNNKVDGLLIGRDFNYNIIAPKDLSQHTPLTSTQIDQSLRIPFNQSFTALSLFISRIYDIQYNDNENNANKQILIHCAASNANVTEEQQAVICLEKVNKKEILMRWKASAVADMIADSVIGLILTLDVDPSTAIAQQMMQRVNDSDAKKQQQSQPMNRLNPYLSSKQAFEFILNQQFAAQNVKCVQDLDIDPLENDMIDVIRYKYVVQFEQHTAIIKFKYKYEKLYDTQKHQKLFWNSKKEKLLKQNNNNNDTKMQKKLSQFQNMLDVIEHNDDIYEDLQYIACFEVECDDEELKQRIESILECVDNALYPISCRFHCIDSFKQDTTKLMQIEYNNNDDEEDITVVVNAKKEEEDNNINNEDDDDDDIIVVNVKKEEEEKEEPQQDNSNINNEDDITVVNVEKEEEEEPQQNNNEDNGAMDVDVNLDDNIAINNVEVKLKKEEQNNVDENDAIQEDVVMDKHDLDAVDNNDNDDNDDDDDDTLDVD